MTRRYVYVVTGFYDYEGYTEPEAVFVRKKDAEAYRCSGGQLVVTRLPLLDRITPGPHEARFVPEGMPSDCVRYGTVSLSKGIEVCRAWGEPDARAIAALPELAALYRASVELSAAMTARAQDDSDENEQRYYSALIEWDFALAAVADKLTKGEGK